VADATPRDTDLTCYELAPAVDYWARLNSYQPESLTEAQAQEVHEENRGDR